MQSFFRSALRTGRISKAMSFVPAGLLAVIIIVGSIGFVARFGLPNWHWRPFSNEASKLAAVVSSVSTKAGPENQQSSSTLSTTKQQVKQESQESLPGLSKPEKYSETAAKGEGLTHLARRALRSYLENNPQSFHLTSEHKVYIEDYLSKKMGGGWLRLGQKVEFSQNLIKEAIQRSEALTPLQLKNLKQYSRLVTSLNY